MALCNHFESPTHPTGARGPIKTPPKFSRKQCGFGHVQDARAAAWRAKFGFAFARGSDCWAGCWSGNLIELRQWDWQGKKKQGDAELLTLE